ncbi:MAG: ATP phosphoribosyltransferase regulatory subunit [Pseudomonadota bacterium]
MARWLLPEGISDVLPHEARRLEALRRVLLDLYRGYGYELVVPPLAEYVDSLLTGSGADLDLRTFKLVDQLSGRMMGLRADTTPQVARIDAHILNRRGVARLCYAGSVLHARPQHPLATREPFQVGAELYGHAGLAADAEILELAVESLRRAGVDRVRLDLGHTGVVRAILGADAGAASAADEILAALIAKDLPALADAVADLDPLAGDALLALARLHGGCEVIERARTVLPPLPEIARALDDLDHLARRTAADELSIDLADLHGYRYHTGVTFAAYAPALPGAVLRGGRYDDIGRAFGRARPATGFSIDLRDLTRGQDDGGQAAILAPCDDDAELAAQVRALRARGEIVVRRLAPDEAVDGIEFDRELKRVDGRWTVVARRNPASEANHG